MIRVDDPLYLFITGYSHAIASRNFSPEMLQIFSKAIWDFYHKNKRDFAWRHADNPYHIVVSEIMLQQTQTQRVALKYEQFLQTFPSFEILAQAPISEVLTEWVGLGYNRRALALHGIASKVTQECQGKLPDDPEVLKTYKGLGPATAGSIVAFAFNKPTVFIETNIRAVFLHVFFPQEEFIPDSYLLPLIALTVDQTNPREWYYALMDYGVVLKRLYKNPNHKSKHYTVQSRFEGSDRQIRGAVVKFLTVQKQAHLSLIQELGYCPYRLKKVLDDLSKEGFLIFKNDLYFLYS